jgi:hypothetical protein
MAARVAAELRKEPNVEVQTIKGGLGEFSVSVGDQKIIDTNRLWYPRPSKVIRKLRALLAEQES